MGRPIRSRTPLARRPYTESMTSAPKDPTPAKPPDAGRVTKLFKVLVVGGAVLAMAYASTALQGATGSAAHGDDDGGTQGW